MMIRVQNPTNTVKKVWIVHPNMNVGGAETQLVYLVRGLAASDEIDLTIAFYDASGSLMPRLSDLESVTLGDLKRRDVGRVKCFFDLLRRLMSSRPDVVYTLLIGPNILSGLLSFFCPSPTWIWGNRVSWFENHEFGFKGRLAIKLAQRLVKRSSVLISNSTAGETEWQRTIGTPNRTVVIPNGIDTSLYQFDSSTREMIRNELKITSSYVIGQIARVVPWKGYETFLRAAALLRQDFEDVSFLCVGGGDQALIQRYMKLTNELGLAHHVHWLGERDDISDLICGIEIITLASTSGEGFPNVIGEAMSSERAIVATNVGEVAEIIGDTGVIVEKGRADILANTWQRLLNNPLQLRDLGQKARERLISKYSIDEMVSKTAESLGCRLEN